MLLVWAATGVLAYLGRRCPDPCEHLVHPVGAIVLAAVYQLTPLKAACLRRCRGPLGLLIRHDAFRAGLEHGVCLPRVLLGR